MLQKKIMLILNNLLNKIKIKIKMVMDRKNKIPLLKYYAEEEKGTDEDRLRSIY